MKKNFVFLYAFIFFVLNSYLLTTQENGKKDIHYFIEKAWSHHSSIKQAEFEIKKYKNLKLEAISVFTPKINGLTWLAPMYTIKKGDDPWETDIDYNTWGPYFNLDLQFQQPILAFSRVMSGIQAANEGQNVARAGVEITKWEVAKEVRLYYYGIIFAKTMLKTIDLADEMLSNAIKQVEEGLKKGATEVSEVDLSKLRYYYIQIPINRSFALKSIEQAQRALFLATGERLEDKDIPDRLEVEEIESQDFTYYMDLMMINRPLLQKLNFGISATRHLMDLEYKSMIPVLFLGGFLKFTAAPTVDMHSNKFMLNTYNTYNGENRGVDAGFAVGFIWQFDPVKSIARGLQQKAALDKLLELHNYAMDGFPLQLYKVQKDMEDLLVKIDNNKIAIDNAQSWMFFAANAYMIGSGEAKDIMEGLAAYVKAKTDYYQSIYDYNKLLGELCEIVGLDVTKK